MQRPIKVGIVCPTSTIYPYLSQDLMEGIMCGLPDSLHNQFQFIPQFVGQGTPVAFRQGLEKLISFDRVDLVTGLAGYRTIIEFVPLIERFKTICLFADMGEYLPMEGLNSDYIYFNSFQYWQAEFALGHWAHKEFGGRGSVFMPVYDSGYHMHSTFRQGALLAGSTEMQYAVAKYSQDEDYVVKEAILEYMEKFRKERPDFIKAIFCGAEATEFFHVYHQEGLHKEIPLIVSPHMASQEVLMTIDRLDMSFHSASMWNFNGEQPANEKFRKRYLERTGAMANTFALLGYEIGLAFEMISKPMLASDKEAALNLLKEERLHTPRGERNFHLDSAYATPAIEIEKIHIQNNKAQKIAVAEGKALPYENIIYESIHKENVSGWLNPYLCV